MIPDPTPADLALDVAETFATAPEGSVEKALCRRLSKAEADLTALRDAARPIQVWLETHAVGDHHELLPMPVDRAKRLTVGHLRALTGLVPSGPKFDGTYRNARTEAGAIEPPALPAS